DDNRAAIVGERHFPIDDAVLPAGGGYPRALPHQAGVAARGGARMSTELLIAIIVTVVGASTPILIAALGELVVEKSGVLNLGVEGMMLVGAITAFVVTFTTGNHYLAIICAAGAGVASSMIFGFLTLSLSANQTATGLALTIFGTGFSALAGQSYSAMPVSLFRSVFPTELTTHPYLRILFGYSPLVYFSLIMVFVVWWFLKRT